MSCKNPKRCYEKHLNWKRQQEKNIPVGEKILETIRRQIENGSELSLTKHGKGRSYHRVFSLREITEAILRGWVIEAYPDVKKLTVMCFLKSAKKTYRPIHVVIGYGDGIELITCYNPRTQPWKWQNNFQKRICFCFHKGKRKRKK